MERNKHQERVQQTNQELRQGFARLLAQKPLKSITVAELCDLVGIHRSTFYAHYKDLYDLLDQLEKQVFDEFLETLSNADLARISDTGQVPRFMVTLFDFIKRNADLCAAFLGEHTDGRFVMGLLLSAREMTMMEFAKVYKKASTSQLDLYFTFMASGCIGLLEYWIRNGLQESAEEMARVTNLMITRGVAYLEASETIN